MEVSKYGAGVAPPRSEDITSCEGLHGTMVSACILSFVDTVSRLERELAPGWERTLDHERI